MKIFITCPLLLFYILASAQDFGIQLNTDKAMNSYTLIENFRGTYLINNCGEIVNSWPQVNNSDNHPKLLPNGNLVFITGNGVREVDWNGNIVKRIAHGLPNLKLDYEVIKLDNGNYLCLARYIESLAFYEQRGYDLETHFPMYDDAVVELDGETGEIVWQWRFSDHIIQDQIEELPTYGVIEDNPGLMDLYSVYTFDYIIYRWGNPQNYGLGASGRRLYFQHNPNWIKYGEHKDKLMIFNNNLERFFSFEDRYSQIEIVGPDILTDGSYTRTDDQPYLPKHSDHIVTGEDIGFYSGYTSGASVLPNGNIYVTVGRSGRSLELTTDGELVWEYVIPGANYIFRSEKYPTDYAAFDGRDLSPKGYIQDQVGIDCQLSSTSKPSGTELLEINLRIQGGKLLIDAEQRSVAYKLFNLHGQLISKASRPATFHQTDLSGLPSGNYLVQLISNQIVITKSIFVP